LADTNKGLTDPRGLSRYLDEDLIPRIRVVVRRCQEYTACTRVVGDLHRRLTESLAKLRDAYEAGSKAVASGDKESFADGVSRAMEGAREVIELHKGIELDIADSVGGQKHRDK
jgi:hypothetical protein